MRFLNEFYEDAHDLYSGEVDVKVDYDTQQRIDVVARYIRTGGDVLEVGAGKGHFSRVLREHGFKAEGLDPKEQDDAPLIRKGFIRDDAGRADASYDGIVSYYVFEHVRNPAKWLGEMAKRLRPDAALITEIPDFSTHPRESLHPEHFSHFTPVHAAALLKRCGFEVVENAAGRSRFFGFTIVARLAGSTAPHQAFVANYDVENVKQSARDRYRDAAAELVQMEQRAHIICVEISEIFTAIPDVEIYVWGANEYATLVAKQMHKFPACELRLIDNAHSKSGILHDGFAKPTLSPSSLEISRDVSKLFVLCSPAWNESIKVQISEMGFKSYRFIDGV